MAGAEADEILETAPEVDLRAISKRVVQDGRRENGEYKTKGSTILAASVPAKPF
jgi:hypothetical protein